MCKLESLYLVHPHPTKDHVFGLLTDNWMSGTLHCSAYITTDHTTVSYNSCIYISILLLSTVG